MKGTPAVGSWAGGVGASNIMGGTSVMRGGPRLLIRVRGGARPGPVAWPLRSLTNPEDGEMTVCDLLVRDR